MSANSPARPDSATPIRLHIERLVLDGVPGDARDLRRLQFALEAELGRLLTVHGSAGLARDSTHLAEVPTPEVRWSAGTDPGEFGRQLAAALFAGVQSSLQPTESSAVVAPSASASIVGGASGPSPTNA